MFVDTEVKKSAFHKPKYPIVINEVNIGKTMVLTRFPMVKKVVNALSNTTMIGQLSH